MTIIIIIIKKTIEPNKYIYILHGSNLSLLFAYRQIRAEINWADKANRRQKCYTNTQFSPFLFAVHKIPCQFYLKRFNHYSDSAWSFSANSNWRCSRTNPGKLGFLVKLQFKNRDLYEHWKREERTSNSVRL